jgi:TetR/AcrR family transcriptional regulator, transcriptional repressor for nem operon
MPKAGGNGRQDEEEGTRRCPLQADDQRSMVLMAAFREIYGQGFRGASIEDIASGASLSVGELHECFASKRDLGHAVIDEVIAPMIDELLVRPVETSHTPLESLVRCLRRLEIEAREGRLPCGCPLNNLAQEMSVLDESFRRRLEVVYVRWREALAFGLRKEQERNVLRKDVDPEGVAAFVVATVEGAMGTMKCAQSPAVLAACLETLIRCLDNLKAPATGQEVVNPPA